MLTPKNLFREGYILDESWIRVFMTTYVNKLEEWRDPKASPLNLMSLSGMLLYYFFLPLFFTN